MSITLPPTVHKGDSYQVTVRQATSVVTGRKIGNSTHTAERAIDEQGDFGRGGVLPGSFT